MKKRIHFRSQEGKQMAKIFGWIILLGCLFSCANLDIENLTNPDKNKTINTPEDIISVQAGAFELLYKMFNGFNGGPHLEWTADYMTMTNNYRSMWSMFKIEPRPVFDNSLNFVDQTVTSIPWRNLNAAIAQSNDVLREIEIKNKKILITDLNKQTTEDKTQMVRACAYFCKAMAEGYVSNIFDKGYDVDFRVDVTNLSASNRQPLVSYKQMLLASIRDFDICIGICQQYSFKLDEKLLNKLLYTNREMEALANSYAAHFMVQNARNRSENLQTNWSKVKTYSSQGISQDYSIQLNGTNFVNTTATNCGSYWYWRVDHRIIRLMDPAYPKRYPTDVSAIVPKAISADARLEKYFAYETNMQFFRLDRGAQLRSHYRIRFPQYELLYYSGGFGPMTYMFSYANQLVLAEAEVMQGNLLSAVSILNNGSGSRSADGNLPTVSATATKEELLGIIFYERDIALMLSDYGLHFNDMRRRDMLQKGTILHFPVPAQELSIVGQGNYSYGGEQNADGANTADGSNSWIQ